MKDFITRLRKPRPVLIAVLFLCIFGGLLFMFLGKGGMGAQLLFLILFLLMAFGFLGSAVATDKKTKDRVLITICIAIAILFFLFSIPALIYMSDESIVEKGHDQGTKLAAILFLIMGIIFSLIPIIVVLLNRRKKNIERASSTEK